MRIAICPGSFDPLTNGHLDVIQRATKLFDRVVVAVAHNESKQPLFTLEERMQLVSDAIKHLPMVEVDAFDCLLVDFAERRGAQSIIRGLRAVSDFEFEFQLALMNRNMNERVETIFMMPKDTYTYLSSRMIKEIARLGGDVGAFVPGHIKRALDRKIYPLTMPLLVNLQQLSNDSLALTGELPVEELDLGVTDEMVQAKAPLRYDLVVEKLEDAVLAQGRLTLKLDCQCVRCLKPVVIELDLQGWACHLPMEGEDAVSIVNDSVDLTPYIREDILLGFPQYPVCKPECGGLKGVSPVKSKKAADAATGLPSSALSELDKLKL